MVDDTNLAKLMETMMAEFDMLLQAREEVRQEEADVKKRREEIDRKIEGLQQSLKGTSLYLNAHETPPEITTNIGKMMTEISRIAEIPTELPKTLSECCRDILNRNGGWMSAVQVRQSLQAAGFDFSKYTSNPLSSIHTTLRRITEGGQAWMHSDSKNETLYKWRVEGETEPPTPETAATGRVFIREQRAHMMPPSADPNILANAGEFTNKGKKTK